MTNRASVLWKILKGLAKKWPEIVVKWTIVTHRLGESVFTNKGVSTMVNGILLNFCKRYKDDLRVIFDQWPKLHLGLDALSNQKMLNGI